MKAWLGFGGTEKGYEVNKRSDQYESLSLPSVQEFLEKASIIHHAHKREPAG